MDYYDLNYREYIAKTINLNMHPIYHRFLPHVPDGGRILDAGCGSGRDSKYFLEKGYRVDSFDASPNMALQASQYIGQNVHIMRFQDMYKENVYDGIWACASLLHVPDNELRECLEKCVKALKKDGALYCSFKLGSTAMADKHGRYFNNMDEVRFKKYRPKNTVVMNMWTREGVRDGDTNRWFNVILVKG